MRVGGYILSLAAALSFAAPVACQAQTQVLSDNFTGSTATQAWQVYGSACLTAGSGAGAIPACASGSQGGLSGAVPDTSGNGMLRLTQAISSDQGGVISLNSFPSAAGFTASFTAVSYGGNGADGIALFLLDASLGVPAALGNAGGGLSYANITGGYLGIGLDEYGNFTNPGCGGGSCSGGPGFLANTVGVRGATSTANAYIGSATPGFSLWSSATTRSSATAHSYTITMTAAGLVSVAIDGTTRLSNVNAFSQTGTIPSFLRVGLAASTGGSTNIHEIKSLSISSLSLSNLTVSKTSTLISDPVNGTTNPKMIPGATLRYCIAMTNITGNPTATNVAVTDAIGSLPVTFIAGSIMTNGTVTSGVCNWNGTAGGSYASGTVSATLSTLAGGATRTVYFDVKVN